LHSQAGVGAAGERQRAKQQEQTGFQEFGHPVRGHRDGKKFK